MSDAPTTSPDTGGEALTVETARDLPPGSALEVINADTFLIRKGFPNGSRVTLRSFDDGYVDISELPYPNGSRPFRFALAAPTPRKAEGVLVPREPTEAMLMAARGLIMAREMGVPTYGYSLGKVAASGYYGEHWKHILTDDERAIDAPLTKAHLAQLIYRAMLAAAPTAEVK